MKNIDLYNTVLKLIDHGRHEMYQHTYQCKTRALYPSNCSKYRAVGLNDSVRNAMEVIKQG